MEDRNLHKTIPNYFNDVFTTAGCQLDSFTNIRFPTISAEQNMELLKPFCNEEIREAIFAMNPDKAPGPDGMNPKFFQHFWPIIGEDVAHFIRQSLENKSFMLGFRDANVVLLPKK